MAATTFVPGPNCYPPVYPVNHIAQNLAAAPDAPEAGLYPPFVPGSTADPGRGTDAGASAITPRTLSVVADAPVSGLFPPFYPGATTYPTRGTNLGSVANTPKTLSEAAA